MKERGQSTAELAIALPAVVFLVWWAVSVPAAGVRSVAARVAVFGGVRQAALTDKAEGGEVRTWVVNRWARLSGGADTRTVETQVARAFVSARATEDWPPLGTQIRAVLQLPRAGD